MRANRKLLYPLITCSIATVLCSLGSPISVREFTKQLTPSAFYDCERVFSEDPAEAQFQKLSYSSRVKKMFQNM